MRTILSTIPRHTSLRSESRSYVIYLIPQRNGGLVDFWTFTLHPQTGELAKRPSSIRVTRQRGGLSKKQASALIECETFGEPRPDVGARKFQISHAAATRIAAELAKGGETADGERGSPDSG